MDSEQPAGSEVVARKRVLATPLYFLSVALLGAMAFVANAPVFEALLPRDPASTSAPDAYVLAAGVVLFLLVLSHFFGASLSSLHERRSAASNASEDSGSEDLVRLAITGLGLCLVVAVLFEARTTTGQVAAERFTQDSTRIAKMSGSAPTLASDSLQASAVADREAGEALSNLRVPILVLNLTVVGLTILAAFLHRGVAPSESLSRRLSHES